MAKSLKGLKQVDGRASDKEFGQLGLLERVEVDVEETKAQGRLVEKKPAKDKNK